ncbi:MAG TPA: PorV/PorQ family protein [Candidatus Cloacimonadota bacterium]|nr:PorV/PorQ family protein [Candidatus Cloacimonadota bacterium]
MSLKILLALFLTISCGVLFAQNENAGTTGFDTLKLIYSARSNAMGGAMLGIAENYEALECNPAAYIRTPNPAVTSTFMSHLVGSGGGSVSYILPQNKFVAWAASLRYWNSGAIDRTDITPTGELLELNDSFAAQSIIATVSTSRFISDALDLGGSLKFIYDSIDNTSATALMIDAGIIHHTANPNIKVGLSARNIGVQTSKYSETKYSEGVPSVFGAGIAIRMKQNIQASLDISKASSENIVARLGIEYGITPGLDIRAGYRSNGGDYGMGGALGWTGGLSFGAGWQLGKFQLDYALSSYGDLGLNNQLSLRYNFAE